MNPVRLILLLAAIGGSLAWLYVGGGRGQFPEVDPWYVDFLVANTRNKDAETSQALSSDVVLVQFREDEKAEYSAWPPAPLDYIMAMKRIAHHEPEVVAFADSLHWDNESPEFVLPLRQTLVAQPSVVFGFEVSSSDAGTAALAPETKAFLETEMPSMGEAEDSIEAMPSFNQVVGIPSKTLRVVGQMGITTIAGTSNTPEGSVPLLARYESKIVPTVAAQAVTLYRRIPYSVMRLRLGAGARLSLGDRYVIPLDRTAAVRVPKEVDVPVVNALDLLTPELGVPSEAVNKEALGKKKIIVISHTKAGAEEARTIAAALSAPAYHQASQRWEWVVAGVTALLAFWQARQGRLGSLVFGFAMVVLCVGAGILVFQTSLIWCSPLPVVAVIAPSTLWCFLWPHRKAPRREEIQPAEPEPA
jgi:hypothetical protein